MILKRFKKKRPMGLTPPPHIKSEMAKENSIIINNTIAFTVQLLLIE